MAKPDTTRHRIELPALTIAQLNALDLLAGGKLDGEVGEAVGVSRQTVCGWRHHPVFAAELNKRRAELWSASIDRLRNILARALERVETELDGPNGGAAALTVLRLSRVGDIDLSSIGPTDAESIIDAEARARRRPRLTLHELLDPPDSPVSDDERQAVLAEIDVVE